MTARPLTPKQESFVRAYLTNGRSGAAAYRAAYKAKGMARASVEKEVKKLLAHPLIAPRIREVAAAVEKQTELTVEYVRLEILAGLDRFKYHGPAFAKLVELAGKHLGMFPNQHQVSGPGGKPIQTEDVTLTPEERMARLRAIHERVAAGRTSGS